MPQYKGHSDPGQRAKAIAGVVTVHAALAAVMISGLDVRTVTQAVDRLRTFDISVDAPPPPLDPPVQPDKSSAPEDDAAPANIRSEPTPVVAPDPEISLPIPLPLNASQIRGPEGMDRTAGAAAVPGSGTGAGGQGSGFGGGGQGGTGTGAGHTPAQLTQNLTDRDYRGIAGRRLRQGSATVRILVTPQGRAAHCRLVRSSGDGSVDAAVCGLVTRRLLFRPARDPSGRAIAQDIIYTATWRPS